MSRLAQRAGGVLGRLFLAVGTTCLLVGAWSAAASAADTTRAADTTTRAVDTTRATDTVRAAATPSPSVTDTAPATQLGLTVTPSAPTYRPGDPVTLQAVVTNRSSAACDVVDVPDGQLQILSVTRDGKALSPSFGRTLWVNGIGGEIAGHTKTLAPGATASLSMDSGGQSALSALTPLRDGSALSARWPFGSPGKYQFQLAYQVSPLAGRHACVGSSAVVTAAFTVGGNASIPGLPLWLVAALAAVLVVVAVVVLLLIRKRRGRARRAAAAAIAIVMATVGFAATGSRPAEAKVTFPQIPSSVSGTYADCQAKIIGFDPGLWKVVNGGPPPTVIIGVEPTKDSWSDQYQNGGPRDTVIGWNVNQTGPFQGDPGGAEINDCAELYHELVHAYDAATGALSDRECDSTGILFDEVRATLKENEYRAAHPPLKPRTTYLADGIPHPLPQLDLLKSVGLIKGNNLDELLNDFCFRYIPPRPKPLPTQSGQPSRRRTCGASSCANSTGDPHMFTVDGAYYDFQTVGEFIAARSSHGDLDVQVRQSPYPGSRTVSVNTAVAVKVGASRLGFYLSDGILSAHRDGQVVDPQPGETALTGGATLTRGLDSFTGDVYTVNWPDGTQVAVTAITRWSLTLSLGVPAERLDTMSGLLGHGNGDPADDIMTSTGTRLAQPPKPDQLHHEYADSWRLSDQTSLFDYASGQGTATFTDRSFPDRVVSTSDLPAGARDAATAACAALGITDSAALDACVLDVAETGQAGFAVGAADVEDGRLSEPKDPTPTAGPTGAIAIGGLDVVASITRPGELVRLVFAATKGQKVSVQIVASTLPDSCSTVILRGPDEAYLGASCVLGGKGLIDGVTLPATGQYSMVVDPPGRDVGATQLRLISSTDQAGTVDVGGPAVTMTIAHPGAAARVSFTATAGQVVFVDVVTSTLADSCFPLSVRRPVDDASIGYGCIFGHAGFVDATTLPTAGTYSLVLDPPDTQTGETTLRLLAVTDQQATITLNGPTVTATIAGLGAVARFTFSGTAGQKISVDVTGATLPNECNLGLYDATATRIAFGCVVGGTGSIPATALPRTGEYTIVVNPGERGVGTAQVRLHT